MRARDRACGTAPRGSGCGGPPPGFAVRAIPAVRSSALGFFLWRSASFFVVRAIAAVRSSAWVMRRPGQILHAVLSKQRPALLPQVLYTEVVLLLGAPTVACVLADVFSYTIDMCTAPALKGAQPQPRTQTRGAPAVKLARCRGCAKTDRRRESIGSKLQAHTPTRIPSARERPPRRRARLCARPRRTATTQRGRTAGRRPRRTCSGTRPTAGAARGGRRTGSP